MRDDAVGQVETTGSYLVLLDDEAMPEAVGVLEDAAGMTVANSADAPGGAMSGAQLQGADTIVFDRLGAAVVTPDPDQLRSLQRAARDSDAIIGMEPERVVYALGVDQTAYLQGYRDAVVHLAEKLSVPAEGMAAAAQSLDESHATWGLQVVRALESCCSGRGVRVAVLDTGADLDHPDLAARSIVAESFIDGETAQDGHGHGTHCIGTACGPLRPAALPRYGIAHEAEIYAGKVLSDAGRGADRGILAGIEWAVTSGCRVVSMSLGAATQPGQRFSRVFERAARRALAAGTVIVAAAGNESDRPATINPVAHPANCPSIMAVAAIDDRMAVARFSNRGLNPDGGQVDIAAPGVRVHSSWPVPTRYRAISGTSMATPHVAGVTALLAEANPKMSAAELWGLLVQTARRLPLPSSDVGAGLVQAP